uniref:RNA-directed RNA polymerase n=1 Tax=Ninarumi virus TaxID=2108521 RepID=A0A2P1K540_9REOV|nr:VP1 [Ninarumi virus]
MPFARLAGVARDSVGTAARRLALIRRVLSCIIQGLPTDKTQAIYEYYRFSPRIRKTRERYGVKYKESPEEIYAKIRRRACHLHGLPVLQEIQWEQLPIGEHDCESLDIYVDSILPMEELEPEEEFLRNYSTKPDDHPQRSFIEHRAKTETQVYGDVALLHWAVFQRELSQSIGFVPLGCQVLWSFITRFGPPVKQNTRDLAMLTDFNVAWTSPLLVEMCITESLLEFNMYFRLKEESLEHLTYGSERVSPFDVIREFFELCLPHPKKINNMLRAAYSWAVKSWGVMEETVTVLHAEASHDRNSKDVVYKQFMKKDNPYASMMRGVDFYTRSLRANIEKTEEAIQYSNKLSGHANGLPTFMKILKGVFRTPFDPLSKGDVILASLLLSIQTITGYGRAWVKNKGDKEDQIKPTPQNYISRVADHTAANFIVAYDEAEKHGHTIVKPDEMYTSLLRLAKNTSSGFTTKVQVEKSFGPKTARKRELIEITSRVKSLVIQQIGHTIFEPASLAVKYDTTDKYQTKGSRDVPIKSTRTIYAINLSVLAPQLLLTLPLNEHFAISGGATTPETKALAGKVIIGALEATGSRVVDAADTFRNTGDADIMTLALDYSEYDQHMTRYNFRNGMVAGIRAALAKYSALRYDGLTVQDLIEAGYGPGRVIDTLWEGKRRVTKVSQEWFESQTVVLAGKFKTPPGVHGFDGEIPEREWTAPYVLVAPTDGSDLARITTHLSGENSTLVANSLHNMAIGHVMQEELVNRFRNGLVVLSEQYVGDDTLFYIRLNTRRSDEFDSMVKCILDTIEKSGHEMSESKSMFYPFSAEKTQTHAKHGIYIPQDRMMIVSSERRKDIENIQAYVRSQVNTLTTKVSRGFSESLAQLILLFKSSIIGYRKMKRTVKANGVYRSRLFDSPEEDGFTLCRVRDPLCLYLPQQWNGFGVHPVAVNIVMTPEMFVDSCFLERTSAMLQPLVPFAGTSPPLWDETRADKHQIRSRTKMGLFSKLTRPAVRATLMDEQLSEMVKDIPLRGYGPTSLSHTMMHQALLKESRARALLAPGYELDYQHLLNSWSETHAALDPVAKDMEISSSYIKIFNVTLHPVAPIPEPAYPDVNLSPPMMLQKRALGPRQSARQRMSYVDQIDSILRGDVIMRGFITATTIMNILEDIGTNHHAEDLSTVFRLMNIQEGVADRLAAYLASQRARFDALKLVRGGIAGDEFSMSMNVATDDMFENYVEVPREFTKTERDAVSLYASQMLMLHAALGEPLPKIHVHPSPRERTRSRQRENRLRSHIPALRKIRKLMSVDKLNAALIEKQLT